MYREMTAHQAPFLIYVVLIAVGIASGIGDIALYKWAKTDVRMMLLASCLFWLISNLLLAQFFRWERFAFSIAVVLAAFVHLLVDLFWDFAYHKTRPTSLQIAGLCLGFAAVVILEISRSTEDANH